jgi:hypothetical protein
MCACVDAYQLDRIGATAESLVRKGFVPYTLLRGALPPDGSRHMILVVVSLGTKALLCCRLGADVRRKNGPAR